MPAPVSNAQCGPTVPGTERPTNGTELSKLNQCPLNACCDMWGQCGITPAYCNDERGPTGNPGTAPEDQNGCISNCGVEIKSSDSPNKYHKVGYYESWNWDRPCLNLRAADVNIQQIDYTRVHWGFGIITEDFNITINDTYDQWEDFKNLKNVHKVLSFGGWGYSTDPATYDILRQAMMPENVDTFVENVSNFIIRGGVDGVDFDWEYPGAPDIPGIPPGLASDGPNYLHFLRALNNHVPSGKTVSIAAPASYWYLRGFPIAEMSGYVDYIVYMTYDLHGQWDYGNAWTQSGCPGGNCLRSHVNLTETEYRLAMITKAGVSTDKIAVGVASYGRSFGMADPSCTGPNCHFTGDRKHSTAYEGRCTGTAGIIANAEIDGLLVLGNEDESYYDQGSDSNVIVYGNDTWAAYMDSDTRKSRSDYYKGLGFGGIVDWAIDLTQFSGDDGNPSGEFMEPPPPEVPECTQTFDSLEALGNAHDSIPRNCVAQYTLQTLSKLLSASMDNYTHMVHHNYDHKFDIYAHSVAGNAGDAVHDFMYDHGNKYFSCVVVEMTNCCNYCHSGRNVQGNCRYCWTDGDCWRACTGLECSPGSYRRPVLRVENVTEPCPPDYSERGSDKGPYGQSVYWSLEDGKAAQFYKDIYEDTGIGKKNLKFGNYDRGNGCPPAHSIGDGDPCWALDMDYNIPKPDGYKASDVANPKKTVKKALDKSGHLGPQISKSLLELVCDAWFGDPIELVDAVSLPVIMIAEAVENMAQVVDIANEITEARQEMIIAAFLSAILFMIPIAGEVLGSIAELADIGAIVTMAGEAANLAAGVAEVVQNPDNGPLAIMNLIFAPAALSDITKVAKAAKIRREMKPEAITKLGAKVSGRLDSIKKLTGKCVP